MNLPNAGQDYGSKAAAGAWRFSLWGTYEKRDDLFNGSDHQTNASGETVRIWQTLLDANYTIDCDWSASATFSYIDIVQSISSTGTKETEAGIGDTVLLLHWNALDCYYRDRAKGEEGKDGKDADEDHGWIRSPRLRLKLDAGMTVPTGDIRRPVEEPGQTPFSALQLGTGTFIPMLGANLRLDWGGVAASADARALLPFYENRHDFQAGTYEDYSLGGEVVPFDWLRFAVRFEFERRGQDSIDGTTIPVGGGWRYLLHPQAIITPADNVTLFLGAALPVHRRFKDPQIDTDVTWEGGLQIAF